MTTVNHECYVSLEVAKLLKQAGFDWKVNHWYSRSTHLIDDSLRTPLNWNESGVDEEYSAPTLPVAQKWLREVKEMYAEAYLSESHHTAVWIAEVYLWENRPLGRELCDKCLCTGIGPVYFDTYEEALEAGIKKALEIILEKGE